jgi:hypothetical protein
MKCRAFAAPCFGIVGVEFKGFVIGLQGFLMPA